MTLHDSTTEGGFAQALALADYLEEAFGAQVEFGRYASPFRTSLMSKHDIVPGLKGLLRSVSGRLGDAAEVGAWADGMDVVIIGSDEVWEHPDPVFFGGFRQRRLL